MIPLIGDLSNYFVGLRSWRQMTRVVLAAAHLDSDPTNNRMKDLRALCQHSHMLTIGRITWRSAGFPYRRRMAYGDAGVDRYLFVDRPSRVTTSTRAWPAAPPSG